MPGIDALERNDAGKPICPICDSEKMIIRNLPDEGGEIIICQFCRWRSSFEMTAVARYWYQTTTEFYDRILKAHDDIQGIEEVLWDLIKSKLRHGVTMKGKT